MAIKIYFCPFILFAFLPPKNIFNSLVREAMPLHKGASISIPTKRQGDEQQILKRKQPTSLDISNDDGTATSKPEEIKDFSKNRLTRSNDILLQSSLDTLLEMLKAYAGIKECSEETQIHLNMVIFLA